MSSEIVITHMRHFEYYGKISSSYSGSSNHGFSFVVIKRASIKQARVPLSKILALLVLVCSFIFDILIVGNGVHLDSVCHESTLHNKNLYSFFFFFFYPKMCHHMCKIYSKYSSK